MRYPVTPDGRYFVVRGRLWRMSNPALGEVERSRLVRKLMRARADLRTVFDRDGVLVMRRVPAGAP